MSPLNTVKQTVRRYPLARSAVRHLRRVARPAWFGTVRRTTPLSDYYGFDRGTPVDRYYIERFLRAHAHSIRGRVLEVKDGAYTKRFGTGVERSDILDIDSANAQATIVTDLATAEVIPTESFDCFILVHTLQYIYDMRAAVAHAFRILKPGGTLLVVLPSTGRLSPQHDGTSYWRFTSASCLRLFGDVFGAESICVQAHGNVLVCAAALMGMAYEELKVRELDTYDDRFPLIITVSAIKKDRGDDQTRVES